MKTQELIEIDKFKELILDMYRGFPNWRYFGMVEAVIKSEEDRTRLIKSGFLVREKSTKVFQYSLGPNSLSLVSAWKTEELTMQIWALTFMLVGIALLTYLFTFKPHL